MPRPEVRLRRWQADDAPAIAVMSADEHLRRWSSMGGDVAEWIERQQAGVRGPSRAICLANDDRALGKVALRLPGHASPATSCDAIVPADAPVGELSYWVVPEARGRGIATAAVLEMVRFAATQTGLRTVVLEIEPGNVVSVALAQRLGAQRRAPERTEADRSGIPCRFVVFVLALARFAPS
ncbi:MAG: GNAT family N-acetyltransferase [Solirubrobacteraceae bacterium]